MANTDPLFRPGIIITVGKTGDQIREYMSPYPNPDAARNGSGRFKRQAEGPVSVYHLLAGVDPILQNSIALLHVIPEFAQDSNGKQSVSLTAIPIPLAGRDFPVDTFLPTQPGPFRDVFLTALTAVQSESSINNLQNHKYRIPDTRTQVYIVGEEDERTTPWLAEVLKSVRQATPQPKYHFEPVVCYLLNCNDVEEDYSATLLKPHTRPGFTWQDYHLPNFTYLYEPVITTPQPVFLIQDEMRYVTGQTLLGLTSTGITALDEFKARLVLDPLRLEDYGDHVGSFSTGMIQFPRQPILHYCSASLAAELMQDWRALYVKSNVTQSQHYVLKNQARDLVSGILRWILDTEERPGAPESLWPTLEIIKHNDPTLPKGDLVNQQEMYARLRELTARLFSNLAEDEVREAFTHQGKKSWVEVADERRNRVMGLITNWANQARQVWGVAIKRQEAEIERMIYDMCEKENDGFESARIFIDELDNRLADLKEQLDNLRKTHRDAYNAHLDALGIKLDGEWRSPEQSPSIITDDMSRVLQLKPTMSGQAPLRSGNPIAGEQGGGAGPISLPASSEQDMEVDLKKKAAFKQGLVPAAGTLFSSSFLGFMTAAFLVSPFEPPASWQLPLDGALAAALLAGNFYMFLQRFRGLQEARRELLDFYQHYFIYQCERFEDERRILFWHEISKSVGKMRKNLDRFAEFCEEHASEAERETREVTRQLFEGPAGRRDVFVADGERLDRTGPFTLAKVAEKVSYNRLQHPPLGKEWHRSLNEIKRQFFACLRSKHRNMLAMDADELQQELYDFMREIIECYLTGKWVSIGAALDKPEIWDEVLRRAGRPMYYAGAGSPQAEQIFVCGRPVDLVKGRGRIPDDAIQMPTNSKEWLLVAAFYRGGQPTKLDAGKAFPLKK